MEMAAASPLASAPGHQPWRRRMPMEVEQCCLQSEAGHPTLLKLRSFPGAPGEQPPPQRLLTFENLSSVAIRCIWINFEGDEVPYSIIKPGERSVYRSFPNHVWVFREVASGDARRCMAGAAQAVVVPDSNDTVIHITDAPLLPWRESTHAAFPANFKAEVQAVLMCHSVLGGGSSSGSESSSSGQLAMDLDHSWSGAAASSPAPQPQHTATLGSLPLDVLLSNVVNTMVPPVYQDAGVPGRHPDVAPCCFPDAKAFEQLQAYTAECALAAINQVPSCVLQ